MPSLPQERPTVPAQAVVEAEARTSISLLMNADRTEMRMDKLHEFVDELFDSLNRTQFRVDPEDTNPVAIEGLDVREKNRRTATRVIRGWVMEVLEEKKVQKEVEPPTPEAVHVVVTQALRGRQTYAHSNGDGPSASYILRGTQGNVQPGSHIWVIPTEDRSHRHDHRIQADFVCMFGEEEAYRKAHTKSSQAHRATA